MQNGPALLIASSFFGDVGNMVIKIDLCFPSNLSKQLTCKQHDTVARARERALPSFVSIAVIPDRMEICIKLIRKYTTPMAALASTNFYMGKRHYIRGVRYGKSKIRPRSTTLM